jgi:type IV secretion system protein VirB3
MALRSVPIRRSGVRNNLFLGGDRELVMLTGLASMALIVPAINSLKAWVAGLAIWFAGVWACRLMAKADPLMRFVYMRHRTYRPYYPAHSTPFRKNGQMQLPPLSATGEEK